MSTNHNNHAQHTHFSRRQADLEYPSKNDIQPQYTQSADQHQGLPDVDAHWWVKYLDWLKDYNQGSNHRAEGGPFVFTGDSGASPATYETVPSNTAPTARVDNSYSTLVPQDANSEHQQQSKDRAINVEMVVMALGYVVNSIGRSVVRTESLASPDELEKLAKDLASPDKLEALVRETVQQWKQAIASGTVGDFHQYDFPDPASIDVNGIDHGNGNNINGIAIDVTTGTGKTLQLFGDLIAEMMGGAQREKVYIYVARNKWKVIGGRVMFCPHGHPSLMNNSFCSIEHGRLVYVQDNIVSPN